MGAPRESGTAGWTMSGVGGRGALGFALASLLLGACAGASVPVPSPTRSAPGMTETVVQSGLTVPWDIAFASDGRMVVTERPGSIDVFASTAPNAKRIASAQVAGIRAMGEAGLLGVALDPDFATSGLMFVCASRMDEGEWRDQILRYRLDRGTLGFDGYLLRAGIRAAGIHNGCRLRIGPDGKVWVATGDGGVPAKAQDPTSFNGKVLRLNLDGSVPSDNPVLHGATERTAVYALGLRSPSGLTFQPQTGTPFVVDAGEMTNDEIDEVYAGANFGWPMLSGNGGEGRGFADPLWTSGTTTYGVAGAAFVSGDDWGSWSNSLFVATLKEQDLRRFNVDGMRVMPKEVLLDQRYGRLRTLVVGPDGALYVTTSNGTADRIIRLTPTR
ncbi:MAG: PQQ-dependent sugar dehydrogenase [Chloroflexi bacterium]|nr:MAG: PQQ-dependent sugar dehydrogenase [Chloroflexota bacterium]